MNLLLRGVRVIDPARGADEWPRDVWLRDGRIRAIGMQVGGDGASLVECTGRTREQACVVAPAFIDLHAHLREPGSDAETVVSGATAAAAGGFADVVAMANTSPAIDAPERVRDAMARNASAPVRVHQVAAVSRELRGENVVDVEGCLDAGAVALSDDGRNALRDAVLLDALRRAQALGRPVLVHTEDEQHIARVNAGGDVPRAVHRPAAAEERAVRTATDVLRRAGRGRLHLQHLSSALSLEPLRRAREDGLDVTAEVTPHHLALWGRHDALNPLFKVNPPLRTPDDAHALRAALREGLIDAIATDHAPHVAADKTRAFEDAAPGMLGLELALATCITQGGMAGELPLLIARLTVGPQRVAGLPAPPRRLREGEAADLVMFDPCDEWTVTADALRSRATNTPLLGERVRGRVLLTICGGRVVFHDSERLRSTEVANV